MKSCGWTVAQNIGSSCTAPKRTVVGGYFDTSAIRKLPLSWKGLDYFHPWQSVGQDKYFLSPWATSGKVGPGVASPTRWVTSNVCFLFEIGIGLIFSRRIIDLAQRVVQAAHLTWLWYNELLCDHLWWPMHIESLNQYQLTSYNLLLLLSPLFASCSIVLLDTWVLIPPKRAFIISGRLKISTSPGVPFSQSKWISGDDEYFVNWSSDCISFGPVLPAIQTTFYFLKNPVSVGAYCSTTKFRLVFLRCFDLLFNILL